MASNDYRCENETTKMKEEVLLITSETIMEGLAGAMDGHIRANYLELCGEARMTN